ncbi:MAG: PQQ-binding-like beta-propeller repeat protein, partial [Planctomycetaceae bacterium]|nr:PQQ-binding-like beta-propeller repeat protein [Planctomycetaceae bacterium]
MKINQIIRYAAYLTAAVFAVLFAVSAFGLIMSIHLLGSQDLSAGNNRNPFAFALRVPVEQTKQDDNVPYVPIEGELTRGEECDNFKPSITGSWSQFRGDFFDAVYRLEDGIRIKKTFSDENKPPQLWSLPLGEGFAAPAIRNGRVYLLDYDMENFRDALRCLSFENGKEIWRFSYPVKIKKNHGMSRTIPAVSDKYCVSLGPKCHVLCVDAMTGEKKWFIDLQHTFGTTEPEWYAGQCPFIVTEKDGSESVIIAPAGTDVLLFSLDCETGNERWRTPNPFGWTMTHASVMPMKLDDGRHTYVYFGKGGVVGVDAENGNILWDTTDWRIEIATCPSPVPLPNNRIFCCGG